MEGAGGKNGKPMNLYHFFREMVEVMHAKVLGDKKVRLVFTNALYKLWASKLGEL
ncbi:GNAT family acetyltransferase [Nostoc cycadae WK-1]|uniref:GNAT family acetyltransferase n=1 Tax=Nostoc cycadae WK-1 TaxID=1861711 RepID=A0A2H6LQ66_9NOSO|nr:GNAT family acetyltransferase [Nostoc cycadae WK-1]